MEQSQPPQPRKRPKQGRSKMLVDAIQQACLKIIEEEGAAAVTTERIADVAGVNIASLYQYFPNKEAIFASVFENFVQSYGKRTTRLFEPLQDLSQQSLEKTLALIIELEADNLYAMYELNPEFFKQYGSFFDLHRHVNEVTQAMQNPSWEDWFPQFLSNHRENLSSTDYATLSFIARNTLEGNLKAAMSQNPQLLKEELFRAELLRILLNYLLAEPVWSKY